MITVNLSLVIFSNFFIRFMHERLRTHAESVAFFGGGLREKEVIALFITRGHF